MPDTLAPGQTVLTKLWITQQEYQRRRDMDENGRAVLITFTHHTPEHMDEDDLPRALTDAAAHTGRTDRPDLPPDLALPDLHRLLSMAAEGWKPTDSDGASRWTGTGLQADRFLEAADGCTSARSPVESRPRCRDCSAPPTHRIDTTGEELCEPCAAQEALARALHFEEMSEIPPQQDDTPA